MEHSVIKKLNAIVGKENVLLDIEDRICYSYDATNLRYLPDVVVFVRNASEISQILKLANSEGFPVIPRGAGTGFTGGALAVSGGVVLALTKMNRIINIDSDNFIAEVEPGVITYDFQKAVEKTGLFYPVSPSSYKTCTLGGNVANCASGPAALKYGVTKDYVIGLEAVLPNGDIINTGGKTVKGVVGYDLTKLIVGSEGTLAVVTKIILRLLPKPRSTRTMLAFFKSVIDASEAVPAILHKKVIPSALEFMDSATIECVHDTVEAAGISIPEGTSAALIIEVDGSDLDDEINAITAVLTEKDAISVLTAKDDAEREEIWNVRRAVSPIITRLAPKKINEDIVVPRDKIPEMVETIDEVAERYGLKIVTFGHAGDGNIHINIMIDDKDKDESARAEDALSELFKKVVSLGGTISGEHGVGIAKAPYIRLELSLVEIELMKRIKQLFDPHNILNPGKIFYYK